MRVTACYSPPSCYSFDRPSSFTRPLCVPHCCLCACCMSLQPKYGGFTTEGKPKRPSGNGAQSGGVSGPSQGALDPPPDYVFVPLGIAKPFRVTVPRRLPHEVLASFPGGKFPEVVEEPPVTEDLEALILAAEKKNARDRQLESDAEEADSPGASVAEARPAKTTPKKRPQKVGFISLYPTPT